MTAPRVLVCAGLDPTGGAGLVADLEALAAVGARGWAVATALTAQGPRGARMMVPTAPAVLLAQVDALLDGARERPRAVKVGMLGSDRNAAALAERLAAPPLERVPLVLDPVLAASSGLPLLGGAPPLAALGPLLARAALATPNWPELEALAGRPLGSEAEAVRAARELPARAVLVKGGHREGAPVDLLVRGRTVVRIAGRRRPGTARGTGCRLASAVAGLLAGGAGLEEAVRRGKRLVERYLDAAR
ncbi:MAG TPA: bifunctional hydroxymethylpyrimidine kinase/phosphomethylpyrimidine kinase [Anaeromyxobacteraceae bacterium]|nr:bifunctional hydroxymethylpyrimidine kinase/phosphomethylpyrimidine kinase [Anaeromyxobacteraceae bacterium]